MEDKTLEQLFLPSLSEKEKEKYSNTVELYDILPKYYLGKSPRQEGLLPALVREFKHRNKYYTLTISPANIVIEGKSVSYYPSAKEELIEDVIRKIAIEKGKANIIEGHVGVHITLHDIRKELKTRGHTLNWNEIKEGLEICSKTNIEVKSQDDSKLIISSPIFPTLIYEDKREGNNNIFVSFHLLVTKSIREGTYRLINYNKFMTYKKAISRWFHKRISHLFIQANIQNPYSIKLTTILRDSGMTKYSNMTMNIKETEKSLKEMIDAGTLTKYELKKVFDIKRKNKVSDVVFSLWLSEEFCNDIKKGNYLKSQSFTQKSSSEPKLIEENLIIDVLKTELNSPEYNLPTGYIETYLLKNTTQEQIDNSLLSIKAAKEYILKLEQEKQVASSSKARIIKKALSEGWKPETQETVEENHKTDTIPEDRTKWHTSKNSEHQKNFDKFLKSLKDRVGEATYDSWFKLNLQSIESEEIVLETKSKLYSQELTNKYESIITEISLKIFNKKFCKILPK